MLARKLRQLSNGLTTPLNLLRHETGPFEPAQRRPGVAIDNGAMSPNRGTFYLAYEDPNLANPLDLTAFSPLAYGEPPIAVTGAASELGGGNATLNGTVNPRGFEVEECRFDYLTDAEYEANLEAEAPPFQGAEEVPCTESGAEIGDGTSPVAVHADVTGLDPVARYRFRLVAKNKYGESAGQTALFGPPLITAKAALPIYTEATLRAIVDPSGLDTKCRFEYGLTLAYGSQTSETTLQGSTGPTEIKVPIFELSEGTTYHFRLLCENEAKAVQGPDQEFGTLTRPDPDPCPNKEFRAGRSAALPDCRAYELVTPADTRGARPSATSSWGDVQFNNWLANPRGEGAGESVAYFIWGATLPGFEGSGTEDGFRAARGEGAHPEAGWQSEIMSPSYLQAGGSQPTQRGVAADQRYWFWRVNPAEVFEGTLAAGAYLRTPAGFEPIGQGALGTDPDAGGRFLAPGATHVIFESDAHLEPEAPRAGTTTLYDRTPGGTHVVSLKPGDAPFEAGESASYVGATEDGFAVAFERGGAFGGALGVVGALYVRRGNVETVKVADAPYSFAGLSEDGERVFYANKTNNDIVPAVLFAFDLDSQSVTEIAPDSRFVNVSADGSAAYFVSDEVLDEAEEGTEGADNLYLWNATGIRHIAVLDPADVADLTEWTNVLSFGSGITGRAEDPSRSTPHGDVLVFESRADLTAYESEGHTQVYRYDAGEETLICVSCNPSGAPSGTGAVLQTFGEWGAPTEATTLISNVTDDGQAIFFESADPLLPEDANAVRDVYEWKAPGEGQAGDCALPQGCLALISSGQSNRPNYLYGMSADGRDVFFTTLEELHGQDIPESPSIYDARVEGGIPDPPAAAECQGDACQGPGTPPPVLPAPTSTGSGGAEAAPKPRLRCPKGKRKVRGKNGKVRCVRHERNKGKKHKHRVKKGSVRP